MIPSWVNNNAPVTAFSDIQLLPVVIILIMALTVVSLYFRVQIVTFVETHTHAITAISVGSILTMITGVVSYWMIANQPTTQTWTAVDVAQPNAFSYAPVISVVCMFLTALAVAFYYAPYDGEKP